MGFETFPSESARVLAFHMPTRQFPGKELNMGVAAKSGQIITKLGPPQDFPCAPNYKRELGQWTRQNYALPEGCVIKIFSTCNPPFGQMRVMANLLVRMRANAALVRIGAILTNNPVATISRAVFEGRFDVISASDGIALGAAIPMHFLQSYENVWTRRAFEIAVVEPENAPIPQQQATKVENSVGEIVTVVKTVRRRMIDI